jgi:arylsulfatase A-like enzyme
MADSREEDWLDTARRMSLLQSRHEVRLPENAGTMLDSAGLAQQGEEVKPNIVLWLPDDMFLNEHSWWLQDDSAPAMPNKFPVRDQPIQGGLVMPNLERIAQSGATFTRAYSSASTCAPSRYSIMTGRYPSRSEYALNFTSQMALEFGLASTSSAFVDAAVTKLGMAYSDTENTVAAALRTLGYTTGMTGKWHLTPPAEAYFDSPYSDQTAAVRRSGFDFVDGLYIDNMCGCSLALCENFSHNLEWTLVSALSFMDNAIRRDLPFFLYFSPTPPHSPGVLDALLGHGKSTPYQTPAGTLSELPDVSKYCSSCTMAPRSVIWASTKKLSLPADLERPSHESCHAQLAALRWLDESLGVLYDFLSERGIIENTYIVMSTDHGMAKGSLYESGTRVPLYVAGPGIRAGTVVDEIVSHVDMAPTFLEWAAGGASVPIAVDGLSWASLASGEASSLDRDGVYTESMFDRAFVTRDGMKRIERNTSNMLSGTPVLKRVMDEMLRHVEGAYPHLYYELQVYNLTADPSEQVLEDESH